MKKRRRSRWPGLLLAVIMTVVLMTGCAGAGKEDAQENAAVLTTVTEQESREETSGPESEDTDEEAEEASGPGSEDTDEEAEEAAGPASEKTAEAEPDDSAEKRIDENGSYTTRDDVALYIHVYGKLPSNFITKKEAEKLGWTGGSLEPYAPGKCIGGGRFGNYEGVLPQGNYKECDIDTLGKKSRGAKRIVYSDDGRIYYTADHYESFTQLY